MAFPAYGQDHSPSATQIQQFEQHVENVRQRLQLTEIQRTDLEPILLKSFEDRINILKSYGFSKETRPKLSLRKKLALRRDMNDLRDFYSTSDGEEFDSFIFQQSEPFPSLVQLLSVLPPQR